jgi:predicted amidohydrolase YtcJ
LTVLSQDIMTVPEAEIPKTKCLMTVINGEVVFEDGKTPAQTLP